MIIGLVYAVLGLSVVAVVWGLISAIADKPPGKAQLIFAAALEVLVLVNSVVAAVRLIGGYQPLEFATTIGYLIGILVLIPIAWFWANVERTRFSGVVLAIAAFAVLGMMLRLVVIWTPVS